MDSRDLASFRRFVNEEWRRLAATNVRIEETRTALTHAYERLARDRP